MKSAQLPAERCRRAGQRELEGAVAKAAWPTLDTSSDFVYKLMSNIFGYFDPGGIIFHDKKN